MRTHRRRWSVVAAIAILLGSFVIGATNAPIAAADTLQNNACLGVTGTFSTFPVPITGLGSPNPDTLPGTITLSGTSVTIGVDSALIGAGVATGLVSAADSLADIGAIKNDGTSDPNAGVDAVTSAVGSIKLKITATNTAEGTQTASNTAPVSLTFYVTADSSGGSVVVYSSISSPPSTTPDPTRTGTVLTGALLVPVPLGNTTWTPTGGNVVFSEAQVTPSTTVAASLTPADKAAAPLILGPKINGSINVPFNCWAGTASVDGLSYTPGASSAIDTVTVIAPPLPPTCVTPQSTSVGGNQSVNVTPSCTDPNGDFTPSGTSITVATPPTSGTATVNPDGSITYSNTDATVSSDSFQYTATDAAANVSNVVTVNVAVFGNQCTASPTCALNQTLILPVLPSTLSMSETAFPGNPDFSQVILGGVFDGTTCVPGPLQLNGQPQTACGVLNSLTVINARGTDNPWSVTGQVTDFIDNTRAADLANQPNACSPPQPNNIAQSPPNNHCIPGGNLGWIPIAQIIHGAVPGDTAAINAGAVILPPTIAPGPTPQVPPLFPPDLVAPRNNTNVVGAPLPGLHAAAQTLCSAPANQSGGTFKCDAPLLLAVPASAAAGTYFAVITLTLA